ncbi:MAG: hypothetical protein Unbinned6437contig1000_26 [Prokaryotic dsDNA virus sp.]|nr:MAG: hypothetical protein Unbinned6437contig1000_26 [Prokaryotic dsDNA virus sp.]|tara:strand:- start:26402 stop:28498 length:2097 start_codon:yes stop_codon:yes gene_type:complete
MATFDDAKRDAADLAKLVNEDTDVTTRYGANPKVSAPKAIRLIETSGTDAVNQIQTDAANAIATLNTSRGFRVVGDFASGFTYELANDVAIDGGGNYWAYADVNALPVTVPAGTTPSEPTYTQVTFNQASGVTTTAGINAQEFIDNFELKIFQSPTDNLTKVSTFAGGVGVVYEVRKTSDNSLATIYSDKDGITEITQNGTANVSNGDAECVFYIDNLPEELKIEINSVSANFRNYLFTMQSNKGKLENIPDVKDFASVDDAVSSALSDKLELKITGNDNTINSGLSVTDYLNLSGNGFNNSKITATLTEDEAALSVVNGFNVKGINLASGDSLKGIGVSSGNNQVAFNSYLDSAINGFKYAIWHRKSLWNSYKNLNLGGNLCGIRLDRADYAADNSNPESPGGWNTGWFNNQLTFDNVLVDGSGGGEVGIWACGMGMTFNAVTCQDILTDGTANKILPAGQVGTGLIIDAGTDSGKSGWNNKVINYYAENVGVGIHAKGQKFLSIDSAFVQGKAGETKSAVLAERSIVTVSGLVGQDSFTDGVVKAIDESTVYVNNLIGPVIGTKFVADATSDIKLRGEKDKDLNDYYCNGTGTPGEVFTFPEVVPPNGFVTLRFVGFNDGFDVRFGTARLYNWNNASASVVVWENGTPPSAVTVAVSNGGVITMTYNSSQVLQGRVQIVQEGGYGISSTGQTLTPV